MTSSRPLALVAAERALLAAAARQTEIASRYRSGNG